LTPTVKKKVAMLE